MTNEQCLFYSVSRGLRNSNAQCSRWQTRHSRQLWQTLHLETSLESTLGMNIEVHYRIHTSLFHIEESVPKTYAECPRIYEEVGYPASLFVDICNMHKLE